MRRLGKWFLLLAFVVYPVLLHSFILKEEVATYQLLLVFAPLLCVVCWVVFRRLRRRWWPLVALLLGGLVYFVVTTHQGRVGLLAVNGLSHATLNLFLLWLFGHTLARGQEPLISQISRRVNGYLNPEVAAYTRRVTIAWCLFFGAQVVVSLLLYSFAPLSAWSFFINVLNLPLLALMFIGEKTYRTLTLPNHPKTSILQAIEVYSKDFAVPNKIDDQP